MASNLAAIAINKFERKVSWKGAVQMKIDIVKVTRILRCMN